MNVCFVNDSFDMGGVQRVVIEIANALQRKGHKITLIDFSGNNSFFYRVDNNISKPNAITSLSLNKKIITKFIYKKNVLLKRDNSVLALYGEQIKSLINYLTKKDFDVLIMNQGTLTAVIPTIKKVLPNLKIVAWQHSEYNTYIKKYNTAILNDYLLGAKQADLLICLTNTDEKKYVQLNKNTTFIYNPLTISNDKNKVSDLRNKKIAFVGRLVIETKGLDYLIEIAKNIEEDWKVEVAGDGRDKRRFIEMIKKNNLENKIVLKGALGTQELRELYLSSSIFISTSRWEGFGLAVTEAMSFGLPIISFDNSGPREILKCGQYGILVEKYNVNKFTENLLILTSDFEKRRKLQKKSLERANDFQIDIIIDKWEKNLKRLLSID